MMSKKHKKYKNKHKNKYTSDVISSYSKSKYKSCISNSKDINPLAYEVFGDLHYQVSSASL